ncbi:SLBB domain-containing protein [Desulfococcaceae bacterium HSG8]|nr:SLBB domain-containing protein [Desulfococcaceae bacterium HSG8]
MKKTTARRPEHTPLAMILLCLIVICFNGCAVKKNKPEPSPETGLTFAAESKEAENYASSDSVKKMSESVRDEYLLGPGDILDLRVWTRAEISDADIIVGPDGIITVNRVGSVLVDGRTRGEVTQEIIEKLSHFYVDPEVTLTVKEYKNNKAFVLGRVKNPGVVMFSGKGTLLEALSLAGGLPFDATEQTSLTKCAIIRGKSLIIWIDLHELLYNGNMALNARIRNNDVIFIPESQSELVYVMGEVHNPGAFRLTSQLNFMDALMMAGGPTDDARRKKLFIIRPTPDGKGDVVNIDLKGMLKTGDFSKNYLLEDGDVIYVAEKGATKFNYFIEQLMPFLNIISLSTSLAESFGLMQKLRQDLWGQEGFVGN